MRNLQITVGIVCMLLCACTEKADYCYELQPDKCFQTIHNFAASDAWHLQYIGKNWPDAKKERIADLLFSQELDSCGNPKGIGLSMWRFNIGSGSCEIGEKSMIERKSKRMECFLSPDGSYDWNKQSGQQWFLQAAKKRGVPYTLAFSNAAPYFMSRNGSTYSPDSVSINLRADQYYNLASFFATVMQHFDSIELAFDYISPLNEPQVDWWNARQEGMYATNQECYKVLEAMNEVWEKRGLKPNIVFGEAADYNFLLSNKTYRPWVDNQLTEMYAGDGIYSVNTMENVLPVVSAHAYWTTWPLDTMVKTRQALANRIRTMAPAHDFWMTEYCILEKTPMIPEGNSGRDLGMRTALYVSRIIHADLTIANSCAWGWWLAVSPWDHKDGLIYVDTQEPIDDIEKATMSLRYDGDIVPTKLLWAMGNYSRFVRPGMVRIRVMSEQEKAIEDELQSIMLSAYMDPQTGKKVVVVINMLESDEIIEIGNLNRTKIYVTDKEHDLEYMGESRRKYHINAHSVVTLVED